MRKISPSGRGGVARSTQKAPASRPGVRRSGDTVVILAAGQGKRMKSALPKVLHPLCGRPMVAWVVDQALALDPDRILIVVGHGADAVQRALAAEDQLERTVLVRQEPQLGTGHALQCCVPHLPAKSSETSRVVVLYGDMPLLLTANLLALLTLQEQDAAEGAALLTARPSDPRGFGRVLRGEQGEVRGIVEDRDASPEERAIVEVNLGVYAFDQAALLEVLPLLTRANEQGEYYLTDAIGTLVESGRPVAALPIEDEREAIGVNTLSHLATARAALQARILDAHMANGVFIEDPATTTIDHGVRIGAGTRVLPCTVIRSGVQIGAACEVGPFAQLRAGTVLEDGAEVGNFTECKKSRIGAHAKAKHLAYLGDTTVGAGANIGAGTIFANYDGVAKHASVVGKRAFIGSGTVVVAPNRIGDGATTGAGAVITKNSNIRAGEVWVGIPARRLVKKSALAGLRKSPSGLRESPSKNRRATVRAAPRSAKKRRASL